MTPTLTDDDLRLEPTSGSSDVIGWAVLVDGTRRGTVALLPTDRGSAALRWNLGTDEEGDTLRWTVRAVRLVLEYAFGSLSLRRVEARIPVERTDDVRAASISGLRREGIVRGSGQDPDRALMARLHDDPPTSSREGFIALLNAGLPTKRVIAQGLLRDPAGRVLLCRLTYKAEWDLPGGVVEVGESPAAGLVREIHEELGIEVQVQGLVTVNWLPAWRGWDDACVFLFDLGTVDPDVTEQMTFQPTEIAGVEWCDPDAIARHATAAATEMLSAVADGSVAAFREAPRAPE